MYVCKYDTAVEVSRRHKGLTEGEGLSSKGDGGGSRRILYLHENVPAKPSTVHNEYKPITRICKIT